MISKIIFITLMNKWNYSLCSSYPFHIHCTSFVAPCYLFGLNYAKMMADEGISYPTWIPHCIAYIGAYTVGTFSFGLYTVLLNSNASAQLVHTISSIGGPLCLGCYAGRNRGIMRQKYNIKGSDLCDCLTHMFCSPCALCQEHYEIVHQSQIPQFAHVMDVPYAPIMIEK